MTAVATAPRSSYVSSNEQESLGRIFLAFAASAVAILLIAGLTGVLFPGLSIAPPMSELKREIVTSWVRYLKPEPLERTVYVAGILATFPTVLLAVWLTRREEIGPYAAIAALAGTTLAAIGFVVAFAEGTFMSMLFSGSKPLSLWLQIVLAAIAATTLLAAASYRWRAPPISRFARPVMIGVFLAVAGYLAFIRVRSADQVFGDMHFEAVFYSVSQVAAGKTVLADLPAQYGLYAELLRPLLDLTGYDVLSFTAVLAVLQFIGYALIILAAHRLIKSDAIFFLAAVSLIFVVGSTWNNLWRPLIRFEYFQVWPIRLLFPSLVLAAFVLARERGMQMSHVVGLALVAGIGILWNLDWGVPAWGSLVAYALVCALFAPQAERQRSLVHLGIVAIIPVAVVSAFAAYLSLKSDGGIDWAEPIKYQRIFFLSGFGMLPLPRHPHPWMAVMAIYLYGLVYSIKARADASSSLQSDSILLLSVMGIGMFTYYQGRSHDVVLAFVMWPAVLIAFLLADRVLAAVREGALPVLAAAAIFPILVFGFLSLSAMAIGSPHLVAQASAVSSKLTAQNRTATSVNIDFIKARIGNAQSAVIVSPGQSVLFAETGLASAVKGPGVIELLLAKDLDRVLATMLASPVPHVFIQRDKKGELPKAYSTLLSRYRIVDQSESGLTYLAPL
jgi:hypothetical protein